MRQVTVILESIKKKYTIYISIVFLKENQSILLMYGYKKCNGTSKGTTDRVSLPSIIKKIRQYDQVVRSLHNTNSIWTQMDIIISCFGCFCLTAVLNLTINYMVKLRACSFEYLANCNYFQPLSTDFNCLQLLNIKCNCS